MKRNGLVMKITDQFMVVMCDDGKFRNLPLPEQVPRVGERITVSLGKKKRFSYRWIASVAALFLIAITSVIWSQFQPAYAQVVAIDINPSLELYVDAKGRVKGTYARNREATNLLRHSPVDNLSVQEAIQQVVKQSVTDGYISQAKENLVMVTVADIKGSSGSHSDQVKAVNQIKTLLKETFEAKQVNGFFKVETASKALYETSKQEGISLNKLILAEQAEQQGIKLDFKNNPSESVLQVLQKAGVQKEQFFVPVSGQEKTGNRKDNGRQTENTEQQAAETAQPNDPVNQPANGITVPNGTQTNKGTSPSGAGNQDLPAAGGTQSIPPGDLQSGGTSQTTGSGGSGTAGGTGQSVPVKGTTSEQEENDPDDEYQADDDQHKQPGTTSTNPSSNPTGTQTSEDEQDSAEDMSDDKESSEDNPTSDSDFNNSGSDLTNDMNSSFR